jgi:hypothetical protein
VALGGFFLTDKLNDRTQHEIAPLSFIGTVTNGYARFIADNNLSAGGNHVGFRLDGDGEALGLFPPGTGPAVDAIVFEPQESGVSEGRFPDGAPAITRFPESVSPAEPNYLPLRHVALHEALTHTDLPFEDAIELRNLSAAPVDIGGWFVSDSNNDFKRFRVPDGTVLGPEGFAVFYENQFNPTPGRGKSFALSSASGETLHLSMADAAGNLLGYRARVKFGAASNAVSFGRYETSTGPDFPALLARSFGQDNPASVAQFRLGAGTVNAAPRVGPVVISEIMYRPPDLDGTNDNVGAEFIELLNLTTNAVPLHDPARPTNTWRLRDAVSFNFPPGTNLAAGGRLLVVSFDPANAALLAAFRSNYTVAAQVQVFGPYNGKLDNSSDSVELLQPDAPETNGAVPYVLVERVKYFDSTPWPALADGHTNGNGLSLQRRVNADYGNDPVNWQAGPPTAGAATGSAVLTLPAVTLHPVSTLLTNGSTVSFTASASGAAPLSWQWRFNGHPITGATNATLILSNAQLAHAGRYAALVSNPAGAATTFPVRLAAQLPPAPVLLDAIRLPGDAFQFTLEGEPGWRYAIERVSILGAAWTQFTLVTNLTGQVTVTDSMTSGAGQRFYRGRVVP